MEMTTDKLIQERKSVVGGEHIARIRARAEESVRAARERLSETGTEIDRQVREHPFTAVGVGLVLGILLARK